MDKTFCKQIAKSMANHVFRCYCPTRIGFVSTHPNIKLLRFYSNESELNKDIGNDLGLNESKEKFRKLDLISSKAPPKQQRKKHFGEIRSPRYKRMSTNQDWNNVWPSARVFHPSTVPLPLYMGYTKPDSSEVPAGKYHNPELLKIPNFLHLSPPAIQKQCEALKKFCTEWPKGLETDQKCDKHFPIQIKTQEFVFSGPSIRWPDYRIVELTLKMSDLKLDYHSKDKMKRLLMERYDPKTDTITITASRCPTRKQNYDYAMYLLTAVYFESLKVEEWEEEKAESDWEKFYWNKSKSKDTIVNYVKQIKPDITEEEIIEDEKIKSYAESVSKLFDQNQSKTNLEEYKQNVLKLLF